jgi:Fic family protein
MGGYDAFIPAALPRDISLSADLIGLLSRADRNLGELMGMARMLPNPDLLIAPLTQRESVLSSQIEGTQASVADLAIFEAAGDSRPPPHADVREVRNYRRALNYGLERLASLPLSLRFVRELHYQLLHDILTQDRTPGEFRTSQNWIGAPGCSLDEATYVPPPPTELMDCLDDWESFMNETAPLPPLVKAAMLHYQFEAIHPFLDGNGRVGRLIPLIYLLAEKYITTPLLYLSPFFARYRDDYYQLLRGVSEKSEWHRWILFFVKAVDIQARDASTRIENLTNLRNRYREILSRAPSSALRLVDILFVAPGTTIGSAAATLGVTWVTANSAMGILEAEGIVAEVTGQRRDRLFVAFGIIDTINEELPEYAYP